ncbi:MAG: MiaB/RimO family radical SAM methylthiotransferase, partial [Candidatus Poribacteria bacterium]
LNLKLDKQEDYADIQPRRQEGVRAWLTIMRGCDKMCAFCIVPFVRGRERSIPMKTLIAKVKKLAEVGFKEVVLLGQTVNSYHDGEHDFRDLLIAIAEVDGIERIRFTSPYPTDITDKMIDVMASSEKICKQIHLPLQSGSTKILQAMRRKYTAEEYLKLVEKMRKKMPNLAIGTDIIVGFCGETEEDFLATYNLMKTVRFDSAFMFKYSPRKGTIAERKFIDDVSSEEKSRRLTAIIELQEKISLDINKSFIGKTVEVLVEGESKRHSNQLFGKTDGFKTTVFPKDNAEAGQFVKVKITTATAHTLLGEII